MKKSLLFSILLFCLFFGIKIVQGQQDPMYTQYMFNMQPVNPGYVGSWQSIGFTALAREQWVGIPGAPSTQSFTFQSPIINENVGIGLNVVSDKIGGENRISLYADYSYRIRLTSRTSLRFGLKGGFTNYDHNLEGYNTFEKIQDPVFTQVVEQNFMPNVGVGVYLSSERYYLGLSAPKLINNKFQTNQNTAFSIASELTHLFLIAGYVLPVSKNVMFKPTILGKAVQGAPFEADLTASFLFSEKIWLGAMYRTGASYGFIAQLLLNKKFRIGYAIDFLTTDLATYSKNSHEIMLSYELSFKKKRFTSPRYF